MVHVLGQACDGPQLLWSDWQAPSRWERCSHMTAEARVGLHTGCCMLLSTISTAAAERAACWADAVAAGPHATLVAAQASPQLQHLCQEGGLQHLRQAKRDVADLVLCMVANACRALPCSACSAALCAGQGLSASFMQGEIRHRQAGVRRCTWSCSALHRAGTYMALQISSHSALLCP